MGQTPTPPKPHAMGGAASISKAERVAALETKSAVKKSDCKKVLESLAEVAAKKVRRGGSPPGLVMVKTRLKPATKAGKREGVRQGCDGQGKASEDGREGLPPWLLSRRWSEPVE